MLQPMGVADSGREGGGRGDMVMLSLVPGTAGRQEESEGRGSARGFVYMSAGSR
jgi:hypothetical protein